VNIEWGSNIPIYVDYLVVNPPGARTVRINVQRHSTVAMSDAEADRILRDMTNVLQRSDSPSDVSTQVRFVRNGPVRVLPSTVPATIQTSADLNALFSAGTGVKVVGAIRFCGGPGGSIIGCAPVGIATVNMAVVPFADNQEGILWAHEYGHNVGNGHRTDDQRATMFPSIRADRNVVNATESARYMSGPLSGTGAVASTEKACSHGEAAEPPEDVLEFVSQHWIEGVPRDVASQYTEGDAGRLLEWLVNEPEEHEEFLPEIIATLCFIGSDVAAQPLIDFVETPRTGSAYFNAQNAALIHLGDLIHRSGNQAATDFLASVAADTARARALPAQPPSTADASRDAADGVEALAAELAVSATMGLSLAGTSEAQEAISRLKSDPDAYAAVNQAATEAGEVS